MKPQLIFLYLTLPFTALAFPQIEVANANAGVADSDSPISTSSSSPSLAPSASSSTTSSSLTSSSSFSGTGIFTSTSISLSTGVPLSTGGSAVTPRPSVTNSTSSSVTSSTIAALGSPTYYYFRSYVYDDETPSKRAKYDNLYLGLFHTGAGQNDVVFSLSKSPNAKSLLENKYLYFFADGVISRHSLSMGWNPYARWQEVQVNGGNRTSAMALDEKDGLVANFGLGFFGGWIACDWIHGAPQLFWTSLDPVDLRPGLPCSCAMITLQPELAD